MKLIIQIPCFNEEGTLPETLSCLPREVDGFSAVEWLIVDDGSTDKTVEVAKEHGVNHIVRLPHNQGLARAFIAGLEASLRAGADIVVNTDGDNQYRADYIPALTQPILDGDAQIVIGARPIDQISHFSPFKKLLQRLGSWVVRRASGTDIPDAPSGFRAYSKAAAVQMMVFNQYTYTLETIIQAGRLGIPMQSVPVKINAPTRDSRLIRSARQYIVRSAVTILRILMLYSPFRTFAWLALVTAVPGMLAFMRFLVFYFSGDGSGHTQSLVIGSALIAGGAIFFVGGLLADLIAANRVLLSEIRARQLMQDIERGKS